MQQERIDNINRLANQVEYSLRSSKAENSPIYNLIESIINLGLSIRASDIHIMPLSKEARIRYRVDGFLSASKIHIPVTILEQLISRIKIMANISTNTVGEPLDGYISHKFEEKTINIRVAVMPVKFGESVALRIMSSEQHLKKLDELNISTEFENDLRELIARPDGMIMVCGPMNSGKTTLLYAVLQEINTPNRNIMSIEDPVEGVIEGINQITVNHAANLDFATGLRAILRMDANVIMVGEIRDEETAKIAIRAALTGHLLLTTIHANDSVSALFRLKEMGAPNYLIAATLSGIAAQRLTRKLCPHCKKEYVITEDSPEYLTYKGKINVGDIFYKSVGCDACNDTGFFGRIPIHEFLRSNEAIRNAILNLAGIDEVRKIAKNYGFKTMLEDGIEKAKMGLTTLEELGRVLYVK